MNTTERVVSTYSGPLTMDRRWKTNIEIAPNCPRCASTNTKFCYYNNYSLSQPRYFCKACRRYWTKGGSLRNVPHGGGCRKTRRGKSVRLPPSGLGRVGLSYSSSHASFDSNSGGSDGSFEDPLRENPGSDIDLAVVFSKFLNPDPLSDSGYVEPGVQDPDYVTSFSHFQQENVSIESNRLENAMLDMEFTGPIPPEFEVINTQRSPEFIDPGTEMGLEGLQEFLISDGISQDILWPEAPAVPNFSWQQQQLQGFEPVLDNHTMFHSNFLPGNWNSFDIPTYGA